MAKKRTIYVYFDWFEFKEPVLMGVLSVELLRGKEVFSYSNDSDWLKHPMFRTLDPDLGAFVGKQYLPTDKSNFGLFLDSSPDRWGRVLMQRREAIEAKNENRAIVKLTETDYLLGVYDGNRMGALRFKIDPNGVFLDNNKEFAAPPWASIRELEYASLQLENDDSPDSAEYTKWLRMLIAPGSSLGGARPKANVVDENGNLWIAKFPSRHDKKDMGAWEAVVSELAKECGVAMAECRAMKFGSSHHTFITKRFDRLLNARRIHFASAMTLLGYTDGASGSDGISYLELAEWIGRNCHNVSRDLEQLWRRIVFNIAVSNCDDHLRNHGFVLTSKGWGLSPAYDINPDEHGFGLKLNITEEDNTLDFDVAMSTAKYYGLTKTKASEILEEVKSAVSQWRKIASRYGISRREQEMMNIAFRCGEYDCK